MRYKLGKSFSLPAVSGVPGPAGKLDVDETIVGIVDNVLTVALPATAPDTHNKLLELRAYLVPSDRVPLPDVNGYLDPANGLPVVVVDVSGYAFTSGGNVAITLPDVGRAILYFGQLVHGYED